MTHHRGRAAEDRRSLHPPPGSSPWWRRAALTAFVGAAVAAAVGCPPAEGDEAGVWCRADGDGIKFLLLDGVGAYSVIDRAGDGTRTVVVDGQPYSIVVEGDITYWHSWIDGEQYANVLTTLLAGEQLVLDGSLIYLYVDEYDRDFDVAAIESCPPA